MYSYQKFRSKAEVRGPCTHRNRFVLYIFEADHGWKKYVLDGSSQSGIFSAPSGLPATVYAAPVLVCAVTPDPTTGCPQGNSVGITDPLLNGMANPANGVVTTPFNGNASQLHPVPQGAAQTGTLPVSEPLLGQDRTSGRNNLRLTGLTDLDLAFGKRFKITESKTFQLRSEMFNALNHPNFAGYVNQFASPNFNTYTTTATNMRQMQLSAGFNF